MSDRDGPYEDAIREVERLRVEHADLVKDRDRLKDENKALRKQIYDLLSAPLLTVRHPSSGHKQ